MSNPIIPCHPVDTATGIQAVLADQRRTSARIVRIDPRPKPGESLADLGPLLDSDQAADRVSMSRSWLYQASARGDFVRPIYIGRQARYPQRWVDAWIAAQAEAQLSQSQPAGEGK